MDNVLAPIVEFSTLIPPLTRQKALIDREEDCARSYIDKPSPRRANIRTETEEADLTQSTTDVL
jgi:hypothetical protein